VRRDVALAVQVLDCVMQRGERDDADAADDGGLGGVAGGHQEALDVETPAVERHRQHAADGPDTAVERELAESDGVLDESGLDEAGSREDAQRHRKIEGRAFLAELGGGEVDGDPVGGKVEPRVAYRGAHAVAALAHDRIRQAHRGQGRGRPTASAICLK
jgi:hypothetical protein